MPMSPHSLTAPTDVMVYAEVIGDPIAQSKSPIIHKYWLEQLGLCGDYRRTLVPEGRLADALESRRADPDWLGCNVTIPHKRHAAALVDQLDDLAEAIGAINCIVPMEGGLFGTNSDVDGIAAVLADVPLEGRKTAIIGAGGSARAAVAYLAARQAGEIQLLVRDPKKAGPLLDLAPERIRIANLDSASAALDGAAAIINATQLGMTGCPAMPLDLLQAVARHSGDATLFDMVYDPLETAFLRTGRDGGARVIGGLTMLVGQAARAFELFFGAKAPPVDDLLHDHLLTTGRYDSTHLGYNLGSQSLTSACS